MQAKEHRLHSTVPLSWWAALGLSVALLGGCGVEPKVLVSFEAGPPAFYPKGDFAAPGSPADADTSQTDSLTSSDSDEGSDSDLRPTPDAEPDGVSFDGDTSQLDSAAGDIRDRDQDPPTDSTETRQADGLDSSGGDADQEDGDASCTGPTCPGAEFPPWALLDFQPASPKFGTEYGLEAFSGKVVVVTLLAGW